MSVCLSKQSKFAPNRPFPLYAPVNKHKEMRTRLRWTISYKSLHFVHPSLELVHLFSGRQERSIHQSSSFSIFGQVTCHVFIIKRSGTRKPQDLRFGGKVNFVVGLLARNIANLSYAQNTPLTQALKPLRSPPLTTSWILYMAN